MRDNVTALRPKDSVVHDPEPVAAIYRDLGVSQAEQVISRALGELAITMSDLADQIRENELADTERQLRRLQNFSGQLGMLSFSKVSADLRACLERDDATAFSAVWARLLRVAERSLLVPVGPLDRTI